MDFILTIRCARNHVQNVTIDGLLGYEWAKEIADLLDGTSRTYRESPLGPNSLMAKCGICKAELMCRVSASIPSDMEKLLKEKETKD